MGIACTRQHANGYAEIGSYRLKLKKIIAKGDLGSVYLANTPDRVSMAVKYVDLTTPQATRSFQKQIEALNIIGNHENIVSVHETVQKSNAGFILMELGKMNMVDMISKTMTNHITETQVIYILRQIASGLQHIHSKKCAHRSIKAENILLMDDGRVKICDFSNSSKDEESYLKLSMTAETENPQKSIRRSKRQLNKGFLIDQKMDMWMFGCIAYVLTYYQAPFRNVKEENIMATQVKLPSESGVSPILERFIEKLLIPDHQQRMTAEEALEYLNNGFVLNC